MDRKVEWGGGVFAILDDLLEGDLHGERVLSLAHATLGAMVSASLAVAVIGRSLAQARGLLTRHAIRQADRLLSNQAIDPREIAARWVPEVIGSATDIQVVMDWTDFDADGQTTLALNKVTPHGRAERARGPRPAKQAGVASGGDAAAVADGDEGRPEEQVGCLGTLGFDHVIRFSVPSCSASQR